MLYDDEAKMRTLFNLFTKEVLQLMIIVVTTATQTQDIEMELIENQIFWRSVDYSHPNSCCQIDRKLCYTI